MRSQAKLSLSTGGDEPTWEGEVEVEFEYTPGAEATRDSPADPAELEVVRIVKIDGRPADRFTCMELDGLIDHIEANPRLMDELFEAGAVDWVAFLAEEQEARYRDREEN